MAQLESIDFNLLYEDWKRTHYYMHNSCVRAKSAEVWDNFFNERNIDVGQRKLIEAILIDIDMISY